MRTIPQHKYSRKDTMIFNTCLNENEKVVRSKVKSHFESLSGFVPSAIWYLIPTTEGRVFTCKMPFNLYANNYQKPLEDFEFSDVFEGKTNPF